MSFRKMGLKPTFIIFSIILAIPIIIYTYKFGLGIWSTHENWGIMGSALGGIYTPILATLTLYMLYRQIRLQAAAHVEQMEWQKLQISREHGIYLCEKLRDLIKNQHDHDRFLQTLEETDINTEISRDEYINIVSKDEISLLLQQLIVLLRKLRHCETGKEIQYHLIGLVLASIGEENLHGFEMRMCRWNDMRIIGFNEDLLVFIKSSDFKYLQSLAN